MISQKGLFGLVGVTGFVLIGAFIATQNQQRTTPTDDTIGQLLLPNLATRVNDISHIKLSTGEDGIDLEKKASGWVLTSRSDYPADVGKIRQLLIGLTQLSVVERKTSNPELFEKLGTTDPGPGRPSTLVEMGENTSNTLASLIIGNQSPSRAGAGRNEYYVRKKGENQNFLTEGNLFLGKSAGDWINKQLTTIDNKRVMEVSVTHSDGTRITVKKDKPDQTDFNVTEPKNHGSTKSQFAINSIGTTLAHLSIQDVEKSGVMDFSKPDLEVKLKTFDGLVLKSQIKKKEDKSYAVLSVVYETDKTPLPDASSNTNETQKAETVDPATVKKEVEELSKTFTAWAFEIPTFQIESLSKRPVDIFESISSKTEK